MTDCCMEICAWLITTFMYCIAFVRNNAMKIFKAEQKSRLLSVNSNSFLQTIRHFISSLTGSGYGALRQEATIFLITNNAKRRKSQCTLLKLKIWTNSIAIQGPFNSLCLRLSF